MLQYSKILEVPLLMTPILIYNIILDRLIRKQLEQIDVLPSKKPSALLQVKQVDLLPLIFYAL